jgi:Wings apart-like protein regulation of heterochromatin
LLSKDRKSNMSKVAQSLLTEHADYLLKLPIWEELQPKTISPRTVGLKCVELMVRQTREAGNAGDLISKELTTKLFSILKSGSDESSWELPSGKEAVDFCLALSTLESHSIAARTLQDESIWISDYLPIIADTLEVALTKPMDDFGVLQILLLRLTLNVTNNNPKASEVFAREPLMAVMGQVIVKKFKKILRFLTEEDFSAAVDHLILVLGVMINFAEWSSDARDSLQSLQGGLDDPLDNMVQLFVDNQESTSMVKTQHPLSYVPETDLYRRNRWRKVKRTLRLATFQPPLDISASCLPSQIEFEASSQERQFGL